MPRAVSTRVGVYFGLLQLVFGLAWVGYVIYLPQLAAQAGISAAVVGWLLVADQIIFACCDWAAGAAVDRVARLVGRVGAIIAATTTVSTLAFLLLPLVSRSGTYLFVALIVVWAITSSALRAPPLALLGRYTPEGRQPWVSSLYVVGVGMATASTPFLTGRLAAYDPRILFGASAVSVFAATLSIVWAEKALCRAAPRERQAPQEFRVGTLLVFLAAALLAQLGFQVHSSINAQRLFAKYADAKELPALLALFWIGFALVTPLASVLAKRLGGVVAMMVGAVVAAASAWAAALATDVVSLAAAQFVCGAAWGAVMVSAVVAALAIGRHGREGTAAGALFSVIAVATIARIALVTAHGDRVPAIASALPWVPTVSWLAAATLLLIGVPTLQRAADTTAPGPGGRG
ncbi:MFS transporter [Mycobacterium stomatepiae]|uniref:MFS transporter n=1 Tax=Mycobacterium stomatepiae TaxID=470076 RepID=A0A7I7QC63_9MYCO|nr:MFS transporter [Mycobacterium stomatepiae]MCV7163933.1 MFS transporter [Mycobacterium stomatepiae]BBY23617.1 MFS transporter [Mycobacterium stomatepiae]